MKLLVTSQYLRGWKLIAAGFAVMGVLPDFLWGFAIFITQSSNVLDNMRVAGFVVGVLLLITGVVDVRAARPTQSLESALPVHRNESIRGEQKVDEEESATLGGKPPRPPF